MITRNATAILAAIFLVTISNPSAKAVGYCSDSQCGYSNPTAAPKSLKITHHSKAHAVKKARPVQVASISNEPIHEAPTGGTGTILAKAEGYIGTNPTGWHSLWCARFIAYIAPGAAATLKRMGLNPNWARDYAKLPGAKRSGQIGDLVILTRMGGGHIGIVTGFKGNNPIVVSGNNRWHKVGKSVYSYKRVLAYVSI